MVQLDQRSQEWRAAAGDVVASFVDTINNTNMERLFDLCAREA